MKKIIIVTKIPSPYRVHLFQKLSEELLKHNMKLDVHYLMDNDPRRPKSWFNESTNTGYNYFFHKHYSLKILGKQLTFTPGVILSFLKMKPDVCIIGGPWATITNIFLTIFLLNKKQLKVCWYELNFERYKSFSTFSKNFKKWILKKYDIFAVPGNDAKKATIELIKKDNLSFLSLPNVVNEQLFIKSDLKNKREKLHKELNVDFDIGIAILPARFSKEKGVLNFLNILCKLKIKNWKILLIGDGPQKEDIDQKIKSSFLNNEIISINSIDYEKMPFYYQGSDLFILPSFWDHNPLTVVEAMWCKLPIVVSERIGNKLEALNISHKNGWVFNPYDKESSVKVLEQAFGEDFITLRKMGESSYNQVKKYWSTETVINNFVRSLKGYEI